MDKVQIVGLAAAYLVIEFVKFMIPIITKSRSVLTESERYQLRELHRMHNVRDEDGRFLWYKDKTVNIQNRQILDTINKLSENQRETSIILDKLLDRLDHYRK
jgi:hypothetical protein